MDHIQSDKRNYVRVNCIYHIQYSKKDKNGNKSSVKTGRCLNVSAGGMKLEVDKALKTHSLLDLEIITKDRLFKLDAEVIFSNKRSKGLCHSGIKFTEVQEKLAGALS